MNDWDAVSNDTPPGSAPDIWDAVSTPQRVPPSIKEPSYDAIMSPGYYHQEENQIDERPAEAPAAMQGLSPDLAAAMQRRRRRQGQPEQEPQVIASVLPDSESGLLEQPAPVPETAAPARVLQTSKLSGAGIPALGDTQQEQPEEEVIATPRTARPPTRRKPIFLYVLLAALLVVVIVGALVFKGLVSFPFLRLAPLAYPYLSSTYQGTGHNVTYNSTGNLTLSSVIENEQGKINGLVTWGSPLCGSGYFTGTVSTNDAIRFTNITADGSACERLTIFTGTVNTENNSMRGNYTTGSQSQIGTWQVSATQATTLTTTTAPPAATATAAQQIYTQATSGTPAIDDPLTDNRNGWDQFVMDWGGECTFIKAATYQITIPNLGHSLLCTSSVLSHFDNFAMQISITPHQGDFAALVFGQHPNGYYSTDIHTDGEYALFDSVNSKFLIQGSSTAIIQGLNLTNVIMLIVNNNQFYFYANGQLLTSNYLSNYVAGSIDLAAVSRTQAPVDIAFSNLKIWSL